MAANICTDKFNSFEAIAGPYAGGVRWVRTNPPLSSQLQNDSAPFLNKLSINNREFGYTV